MDDSLDLDALRASVADVLANECDREAVLRHASAGRGPMHSLWQTATGLGWLALPIPEELGGLGLGLGALVPLYHELGRVAAPLPVLSTLLTADAVTRMAPRDVAAGWLERIAAGAMATLSAPLPEAGAGLSIRRDGDCVILSGNAADLLDARDAELILVTASDGQGGVWRVMVEAADAPVLATTPMWDHGHTLSVLQADGLRLPADRAFASRPEEEEAVLTHAALGLAAEAVGGAEGILALTVDYLKTREQFGKPIGSFQALKHRVADHRTRTVAARSLLEAATRLAQRGEESANSEASCAKALACANYAEVARDCIQLHGGMGFTAEQVCHLYLKRACLNAQLYGDAPLHLARATNHLIARGAAL